MNLKEWYIKKSMTSANRLELVLSKPPPFTPVLEKAYQLPLASDNDQAGSQPWQQDYHRNYIGLPSPK
ncbi:MAG: hypothetical protein MJA30_19930 [Cytophagales bacterium]|nr:hypothetical protein [Cytophagales bacterium]